jgi:FkbM family methyltransferase
MRRTIHGVEILFPPSHILPSIVANFPRTDTLLPEFLKFLSDERRTKLLVIDVGANVGDTAALVAARVGADKIRLICLEADEEYLPFLKENTKNVDAEIICAIVGSSSGVKHVALKRFKAGTGAIVASSETATVRALDDLLTDCAPDLIKIDTDGYDIEVLRGAVQCLQNRGPHLFLEYAPHHIRMHLREEPANIFTFLRGMGYGATIIYDNTGYPICLLDLDSRILAMIAEYVDAKPAFHADLLVSKNSNLLARFYECDRKRFAESAQAY